VHLNLPETPPCIHNAIFKLAIVIRSDQSNANELILRTFLEEKQFDERALTSLSACIFNYATVKEFLIRIRITHSTS